MLELWLHLCSLVASCQSESCLYLFYTPLLFHMFSLSYIWGSIADSKGRKPVIVTSAILTGAASVAFGFSTTFAMAVILRFFVGFLNGTPLFSAYNTSLLFSAQGIVGTLKASLSESSDNTNQAFGMAVLTSAFGTGLVIGPALSGAIADPVGQYNLNITSKLFCECVCECVCV